MSYEVLARKYRPTNFSEIVGQDHIVKALSNGIEHKRIHQAYIFAGTRGVGKTTIARILAKCLNCSSKESPVSVPCDECNNCNEIKIGRHLDFLEVDAASKTGVDDMRELLDTIQYKPSNGRYKIYLIDEVHMLSKSSFNALLKSLEEPPAHVIFIFATTNPENIPKTVQSRCLQLNLKTVPKDELTNHFKKIMKSEKVKYDDESLSFIAEAALGSVRDGLTLLDQAIAHGNGELNNKDVKDLLGTIDDSFILEMLESIFIGDGEKAFNSFYKIEELSPEYEVILKNIISIIHKLSIEKILKNSNDDLIKNLAEQVDEEFCQLLYEIAVNAYSKFNVHPSPKEALEICILRMLAFNPINTISKEKNETRIEKKNPISNKGINKKVDEIKPEKQQNDLKINSHEEWNILFEKLNLSVFATNYFSKLSFKEYKNNEIFLEAEEDFLDIPVKVVEEFEQECSIKLDQKIGVKLEIGNSEISPGNEKKIQNEINTKQAEENIKNDETIQNFLKKIDGRIVDDSIKPIN